MDLPAVIRHIDQPTICQAAVLQLRDLVGGCLAVRRQAQRRLEALARTFDDLRRQAACRRQSAACPRRRACRRARSGSLPPMPAASDRDRTLRRRCGSRYAFCARQLRCRQGVSHLANSQYRPGSAAGRDRRCRGVRPRPARGRAAARRPCRRGQVALPTAPARTPRRALPSPRRRCSTRRPAPVRSSASRRGSIPPSPCRLTARHRRRPDRSSSIKQLFALRQECLGLCPKRGRLPHLNEVAGQ